MRREPWRSLPPISALRGPFRPRRVPLTTQDLAVAPTLRIDADSEGWPSVFTDASALAKVLLQNRCTLASGPTDSLWKLMPPHIGAALAASVPGRMVKDGDYLWGWLPEGSLMVRKGQQWGHLCNLERLTDSPNRLFRVLADIGIFDCGYPNSSGSVAQAILLNHAPLPNLTTGEIPWPVLQLARQCDKGGRMEALKLGTFEHVYCYDYTAAYAACLAQLPDARRCVWIQSTEYHAEATFGFIHALLRVPAAPVSPIALRLGLDDREENIEGLRFVHGNMEVSLIQPEFDLALEQGAKAEILDAWWGYEWDGGSRPFEGLVAKLFALRQSHPELKAASKMLINAMIGQFSSSHEHTDAVSLQVTTTVSPAWNPVYASYVRGMQRVKLFQDVKNWDTIAGLTIDGMLSLAPMELGPGTGQLGALRLDSQGTCTILTDYAKDRPGKAGQWRQAAQEHPTQSGFLLPLTYRAGLRVYNQPGLSQAEAHRELGRWQTMNPEFPIGSCTRRTPVGVTTRDLLRDVVLTQSMDVGELG